MELISGVPVCYTEDAIQLSEGMYVTNIYNTFWKVVPFIDNPV